MLYFSTVVSREDTKVCSSVPSAGILIRKYKAMTLGTRLGLVKCVLRTALAISHSSIKFPQLVAACSVFLCCVRQMQLPVYSLPGCLPSPLDYLPFCRAVFGLMNLTHLILLLLYILLVSYPKFHC